MCTHNMGFCPKSSSSQTVITCNARNISSSRDRQAAFQSNWVTTEIIRQILAALSKSVVAKFALDYICLDSC